MTTKFDKFSALELAEDKRIVRVSVPVDVAYNFDKLVEVQKDILGRLGCMACCSGWDIRWDVERRFAVDEKLRVRGFER